MKINVSLEFEKKKKPTRLCTNRCRRMLRLVFSDVKQMGLLENELHNNSFLSSIKEITLTNCEDAAAASFSLMSFGLYNIE